MAYINAKLNFGIFESNISYTRLLIRRNVNIICMSVLIPMINHLDINYCHLHDKDEKIRRNVNITPNSQPRLFAIEFQCLRAQVAEEIGMIGKAFSRNVQPSLPSHYMHI